MDSVKSQGQLDKIFIRIVNVYHINNKVKNHDINMYDFHYFLYLEESVEMKRDS